MTVVSILLNSQTIIGNTKKTTGAGGAATLTKDQLRELRDKTDKGQKSEAIVLKADEVERMKAATKIQTKEQESQQRRLLEEQKDSAMAAAKARK